MSEHKGPLVGTRVIEIAGMGPGPFCCMLLADLGAEVIRIDRASEVGTPDGGESRRNVMGRGRPSVGVDLKQPEGVELVLRLAEQADVLVEGFRPGVMERLGLGPAEVMARSPGLVYGRMTGWGQDGPLARAAGHDINYIALTGALYHIGPSDGPPVPPLNLVGDFGGGGMLLAFGVLAALLERHSSGAGQVVDAAVVDGAATLMAMFHGWHNMDSGLSDSRGTNRLDGGAHYYRTYRTADGKYVAVGSIEDKFYSELLAKLGIATADMPDKEDREGWNRGSAVLGDVIESKTRQELCDLLEGSDACFAPVLSLSETYTHPHNAVRQAYVDIAGIVQPAPSPRFSRTPGSITRPAASPGENSVNALLSWGIEVSEVERLVSVGAVRQAPVASE